MTKNNGKKIKIGLLCAFDNGIEIFNFISKQKNKVSFVCSYKKNSIKNNQILESLCLKSNIKIYKNIDTNLKNFEKIIIKECPDMLILAWWPQIIKTNIIKLIQNGIVNLHPSYLPYGRGKYGYVWSIINNHPYGATIHFIDKDIDSGEILFQKKIKFSMLDTGETLYNKGSIEVIKLFKKNYNKIIKSKINHKNKSDSNKNKKFLKFKNDIKKIETINPNKKYKAIDLINILRAKNFKNDSAIFHYQNKQYHIRILINEK